MGKSKKAFFNIVTNVLVQVATGVSGFVVQRLILNIWGSEINGLVSSISQFLTYAALVEMGIGNAAIVALYKPIVDKDIRWINKILGTATKRYIYSGIIYTAIVCGIAMLYPFVVHIEFEYKFIVSMVFVVALSGIVDFFVIGKYKVFLIASQKYYVLNVIKVIVTFINIIVSIVLLLNKYSIIIVKGSILISKLIEILMLKAYIKEKNPKIRFDANNSLVKIEQQSNALVHQIASVVVYNTDLVLLTLFMTTSEKLKEVSVYAVYCVAFSAINNLITTLTTGMDAIFGVMIVKGQKEKVVDFFEGYEYWYLLVVYILFTCFMVLILPFIFCYTKNINDVNYLRIEVGILFGINGILATLKDPFGVLIKAYGHYKQTQKFTVGEAVINIVISILLVNRWGIQGVLIGTAISHLYMCIEFARYVNKKLLLRNWKKSLKNNFYNILIMAFLVAIELKIVSVESTWKMWIIEALLIGGINTLVYLVGNYFLNGDEMKKGKEIFKCIIMRKICR